MATREERIRDRLFPGVKTYDRKDGGFAAVPLILRRAQFLFDPRRWQIYTYICMRAGAAGVAWFNLTELGWDIGFNSVPKLRPYVDSLVSEGWVKMAHSQGKDYYVIVDPLVVLARLFYRNELTEDRKDALDE